MHPNCRLRVLRSHECNLKHLKSVNICTAGGISSVFGILALPHIQLSQIASDCRKSPSFAALFLCESRLQLPWYSPFWKGGFAPCCVLVSDPSSLKGKPRGRAETVSQHGMQINPTLFLLRFSWHNDFALTISLKPGAVQMLQSCRRGQAQLTQTYISPYHTDTSVLLQHCCRK